MTDETQDDDLAPLTMLHYHELLERLSMLESVWQRELVELRVVQCDDALRAQAEGIADAIAALYQAAGVAMVAACNAGGDA